MFKKSVFNAEKILKAMSMIFVFNVFADEGEKKEPESVEPKAPIFDFEKMIAQARKEEKDKLYPQLEKVKKELNLVKESNNNLLLENAQLKEKVSEIEKNPDTVKEVEDLKAKIYELEKALEEEKEKSSKVVDEETIRKQIAEEYEIKNYLSEKVKENEDKILKSFVEDVVGNTKEEIDASIEKAIEKSNKIKEDLGIVDSDEEGAGEKKEKTKKEKNRAPEVNPPSKQTKETFDPEYIRNLDPRSKEYKEFREKMGLR